MIVYAKGRDGVGWYIVEIGDDGARSLAHWTRYNLREAADSYARFMFAGKPDYGPCIAMFWDGKTWSDGPA